MPPGALPPLGQLHRLTGCLPLLQAVLSRQPADPLPVAAAGILVHVGIVTGGVSGQHPFYPARPLQKGSPLCPGQGPQGGEGCPRLLWGHPVLLQGLQVAAQSGQPRRQPLRQGRDQQGQLPLSQRTHRLKALQKQGQPALVQVGHRPQSTPGAQLEQSGAPPRPSERPAAPKRAPGPFSLPDGQIVVIQQPFHRPGQIGLAGAPGVQRLPDPANLTQIPAQRPGQPAAGDRSLRFGLFGSVGGVFF